MTNERRSPGYAWFRCYCNLSIEPTKGVIKAVTITADREMTTTKGERQVRILETRGADYAEAESRMRARLRSEPYRWLVSLLNIDL